MMAPSDSKQHWTVDKKIPLAFLAAIIVQTSGIAYWAATTDGRLRSLEENDKRIEIAAGGRVKLEDDRYDFLNKERDRVLRIESQMMFVVDTLKRIEQKLEGSASAPRNP